MISVCIATYNGEKYINQQLESILKQLGDSDEIIISDDESTDRTLELINGFKDKRIKVYKHTEKIKTSFFLDAPTHNFANALKHAQGEYIFLADQDDIWLDGKVNKMIAALQEVDFVVSDCIIVNDILEPIAKSYFEAANTKLGIWNNLVHSTYLGCNLAFRRKVLEQALPFPQSMVGHDLWLGLIAESYFKAKLLNEPLMLYRKHGDSVTTSGLKSSNPLYVKISYRAVIVWELFKKYVKTLLET